MSHLIAESWLSFGDQENRVKCRLGPELLGSLRVLRVAWRRRWMV